VTGQVVREAEALGVGLDALPLAAMRRVDKRITRDVFSVLGVDRSVASRTSFGGTAPALVRKAARDARRRFLAKARA
jgi:argininosuccinate lyase